MINAKHIEIHSGFAQIRARKGAKDRTSLKVQYTMKNTTRNAIPNNGTVGITEITYYESYVTKS